jgi:hypothetical protein
VNGDVIGFIALNEILGLFFGGVVCVALEVHVGNRFFMTVPLTRPASEFQAT